MLCGDYQHIFGKVSELATLIYIQICTYIIILSFISQQHKCSHDSFVAVVTPFKWCQVRLGFQFGLSFHSGNGMSLFARSSGICNYSRSMSACGGNRTSLLARGGKGREVHASEVKEFAVVHVCLRVAVEAVDALAEEVQELAVLCVAVEAKEVLGQFGVAVEAVNALVAEVRELAGLGVAVKAKEYYLCPCHHRPCHKLSDRT